MTASVAQARIAATAAARRAITGLRAAVGGPVMFVQSGGCCAGSTPMCYPDGEFLVGDGPGPPEGFSLAAGDDQHFVTRSSGCDVAEGSRPVAGRE